MKKLILFLLIALAAKENKAQTKSDFELGLDVMEKRGDIRREGNRIIVLKQNPGDTALMRGLYNKMLENAAKENPYTIGFEIDPKYLKNQKQLPKDVKHNIPAQQQTPTVVAQTQPQQALTNLRVQEGRYIIQLQNGRVLEAPANTFKLPLPAGTQISSLKYTLNQLWDIRSAGEGKYFLTNVGSGRRLRLAMRSAPSNGAMLVTQTNPEVLSDSVKWLFQSAGSGKYTIRNATSGASNRVLDVRGNAITTDGARVQLWDVNNNANQVWLLIPSHDSAVISPGMVDLRKNQTGMKNQKNPIERGSCTYFGNIAALEAAYKKRGTIIDLSEEYFSIMAKVMYLEPYWDRVSASPNRSENQFGATMGGGSLFWYTNGLRVPLETDVPFRPTFAPSLDYASNDQRVINDFNTTQLTANVLKANTYYGAISGVEFTDAQRAGFSHFQNVLDLGYEINLGINNGEHNVLVVGYDNTNPAEPKLFIKDSYDPLPGRACSLVDDRRSFAMLLTNELSQASYITEVRTPGSFPEVAFMGRWHLDFDGHRGLLDVYHIPGINYTQTNFGGALRETNGGAIIHIDNRVGVFYDETGNAFRVNGKITGKKIEFYLDLSAPNQRWDELRGRKFTYYLNATDDIMSGMHVDADGSTFGGYATKAAYITHPSSENSFSRFMHSTWRMQWGDRKGTLRFSVGEDESRVSGFFNDGTGDQRITIDRDSRDRSQMIIRMGTGTARAKFFNHETGMIAGNDDDEKIVLIWKE